MISARKIQCALGLSFLLLCMARVGAAQTPCASPWNSTSVYTAGMTASLNGINYTANFWTQNQSPATNNGGPGSGQPWTSNGACSGSGGGGGGGGGSCATPWNGTGVYTAGMTANLNGVNYQANFGRRIKTLPLTTVGQEVVRRGPSSETAAPALQFQACLQDYKPRGPRVTARISVGPLRRLPSTAF